MDDSLFRTNSYSSNFTSLDMPALVQRLKKQKYDRVQRVLGEVLCGDMILVCLRARNWNTNRVMDDILDTSTQAFLEKIGVVFSGDGASFDLALQDDHTCFLCGQTSKTKRVPLSMRDGALNPLAPEYNEDAMKKLCPVCCQPAVPKGEKRARDEEMFSCPVCWNDVPLSKTFALGCGHRYCEDCWVQYLKECITAPSNLETVRSVCMSTGCTCPVPDCVFSMFIHETVLLKKYMIQSLKQFIACDAHYKWCPFPSCDGVMFCDSLDSVDPVTCQFCHHSYCYGCSDPDIGDHRPCSCEVARKWIAKASDEQEDIAWLKANTKQCPKCHAAIEKNGGCMHMTCRKESGGCGYEFCWLCRGPWSEHGSATGGYYSCNKYENSAAKKEDEKAAETKKELEDYMFYYHRYDSHRMACKSLMESRKQLEARRGELATRFRTQMIDTAFLGDTLNSLIMFHRALEFSYAHGYYIEKDSKQLSLFQYSQELLEKFTIRVTELFEMKKENIPDFYKWKDEILNDTRLAKKFLDNFSRDLQESKF